MDQHLDHHGRVERPVARAVLIVARVEALRFSASNVSLMKCARCSRAASLGSLRVAAFNRFRRAGRSQPSAFNESHPLHVDTSRGSAALTPRRGDGREFPSPGIGLEGIEFGGRCFGAGGRPDLSRVSPVACAPSGWQGPDCLGSGAQGLPWCPSEYPLDTSSRTQPRRSWRRHGAPVAGNGLQVAQSPHALVFAFGAGLAFMESPLDLLSEAWLQ